MKPVFRRIWGFGPWGWGLLPVALLLAWCAAGGFDLQHAIIARCIDLLGFDRAWDLMHRKILFGSYWGSITGGVVGPITLLPMLAAMHLAPRRWSWWQWLLVSLWMILNPFLQFTLARAMPGRLAYILGWPGGRPGYVVYGAEVLGLTILGIAMLALLVRRMSGDAFARTAPAPTPWRLAPWAVFFAGAALSGIMWGLNRAADANIWVPSYIMWVSLGALSHVVLGVLIVGYAIAARRCAARQPWFCEVCNYDLRGLPSDAATCPECGQTLTAPPQPATPTHPNPHSPAFPAA